MTENNVENKNQLDHIYYARNVLHAYSPATQRLLDMCVDYIPFCTKAYEEKKNVIWALTGGSVCPIIYGSGALAASITEIGRLSDEKAIILAEDYFQVPNETCAMVKSDIGEFYLRRGKIANKILYSGNACEPYQQAFEVLKDYGYDVRVNDVGFRPNTKERVEEHKKHLRENIIETIRWISGKEPDLESIRREQIFYNKIQKKLRYVLDLRAKHPTYIGSLSTMILIMGNNHYFARPKEYEEMLDELIAELEALPEGAYHDEKVILGWSGSRGQEFNIFEDIDASGGAILAWNLPNNIVHEFNTSLDPIDACVEFEVGDFHSGTTEQSCQSYVKLINKFKAKGIVMYTYMGCSFYTIDIELRRQYFKERGIPALALLGSFDVGSVTGQVSTRIRAFVEMLSAKEKEIGDAV